MDSTSQLLHLAPVDEPTSVRQLADRLFSVYSVDRGSVRLAGCRLENRLFVRLEFRVGEEVVVLYVDADGREVATETVEALGMSGVTELQRPPGLFEPIVDRAAEAGARLAARRISDSDADNAAPQLIAMAVLWYKFAEGKLRFSVGEHSVDLPFSGWARTLCPPPFVCPYSGTSTFEIAATDDGRIAAASQIVACEETGQRMLSDELITCSVTARRVLPELIESGIDIINPVQPLADGMEPAGLKADFGDRLVFHGGIDVQSLLPHGTPDKVARHTRQCVCDFQADRGGYILAPSHNVQADVPPENILAMIEAAKSRQPYTMRPHIRRAADENLPEYKHEAPASES